MLVSSKGVVKKFVVLQFCFFGKVSKLITKSHALLFYLIKKSPHPIFLCHTKAIQLTYLTISFAATIL